MKVDALHETNSELFALIIKFVFYEGHDLTHLFYYLQQ